MPLAGPAADESARGEVLRLAGGLQRGLRLADYWKLEERKLGETDFYYFADGTAHKNRMQGNDFSQSLMYRRGMTCFDCHDVHGTGNYAQLIKPAKTLCMDCHGPSSPNGPHATSIEAHTHHKADSAGSQCVACHMPAIETEGVPGAYVHAHTFKVITPQMTEQYKVPNPCTSCHNDKTTAWATPGHAQLARRVAVADRIGERRGATPRHLLVRRESSERRPLDADKFWNRQREYTPAMGRGSGCLTRLLLWAVVAVVLVWGLLVALNPWALHIGGRSTPLLYWHGAGTVLAKGGKVLPLYVSFWPGRPQGVSAGGRREGKGVSARLKGTGWLCLRHAQWSGWT